MAGCYVLLVASLVAQQASTSPPPCTTPVSGTFTSRLQQPDPACPDSEKPCTAGKLTGVLTGDYTFTKTRGMHSDAEGAALSVKFYVGKSAVVLDQGRGEVTGIDTGAVDEKRGTLASMITWTGGTGAMQNATGQIRVRGMFDPKEGAFTGDYVGTLCGG